MKAPKVKVELFCPKCGDALTYAIDENNRQNNIVYLCTKIGCEFRKVLPLNEHILDVKRRCGSWATTAMLYDRLLRH